MNDNHQRRVAIAIHGGSGTINRTGFDISEYESVLMEVVCSSFTLLNDGVSSLDVVEKAVQMMEDCPLFNAGKGSVLNYDGKCEMDASIMDGSTLKCGAVGAVSEVKNPICLARAIMEETRHILLVGDGALEFGRQLDIEFMGHDYFVTDRRLKAWQNARGLVQLDHDSVSATVTQNEDEKPTSTVGAVALDQRGHLSSATSTGGMNCKLPGRVGDSAIIGAGTFACDLTCAVSTTGVGEEFIRHSVARSIHEQLLAKKENLEKVVIDTLNAMGEGIGGLVAVNSQGTVVMPFTTKGMFRGAATSQTDPFVAVWK